MRIAVISDIHANLQALTSVLERIDKEHVEEIVCLGDVVGYGANPNECAAIVRERCAVVLLGNHDFAAVNRKEAEWFSTRARQAILWTADRLTPDNIEFLRTLPYAVSRNDGHFVHASPCNPEWWDYVISEEDARECFECFPGQLCFLGHTHVPMIFSETGRANAIDRKHRFVINPGSVGQPRDGNPDASFGILDTAHGLYQNIRVPYNIAEAAERIIRAGLPSALAERLAVGM